MDNEMRQLLFLLIVSYPTNFTNPTNPTKSYQILPMLPTLPYIHQDGDAGRVGAGRAQSGIDALSPTNEKSETVLVKNPLPDPGPPSANAGRGGRGLCVPFFPWLLVLIAMCRVQWTRFLLQPGLLS